MSWNPQTHICAHSCVIKVKKYELGPHATTCLYLFHKFLLLLFVWWVPTSEPSQTQRELLIFIITAPFIPYKAT